MKKLVFLSLVSLFSISAFADQCAYITKEQAKKAVKEIYELAALQTAGEAKKGSFKTLCEPCGEKKAVSLEISSVGYGHTGYENYYEVRVNGKGIDLAYTYVADLNLAKYIGCDASGVSDEIK